MDVNCYFDFWKSLETNNPLNFSLSLFFYPDLLFTSFPHIRGHSTIDLHNGADWSLLIATDLHNFRWFNVTDLHNGLGCKWNAPERFLEPCVLWIVYVACSYWSEYFETGRVIGRRQWHALGREEQSKYYELARKERQVHMQLHPGWTARDNYAQGKKRKRRREKPTDAGGPYLYQHPTTSVLVVLSAPRAGPLALAIYWPALPSSRSAANQCSTSTPLIE